MQGINLKVISWVGMTCSFIGVVLNVYKIVWCWPIWLIGNCFWIYWSYKKREPAQLILWVVYQIINMLGWYQWMFK